MSVGLPTVAAVRAAGDVAGVAAGRFVLNGYGEMTGGAFLDEMGALFGPAALTNTLSVGVVRDALVAWSRDRLADPAVLRGRTKPVVAETWDGRLNDVYGQHVRPRDAFAALDAARTGSVEEGSVGGGTGMVAFDFKAGIGTASRRVATSLGGHTLGVLVQANFGRRAQLRVAGVPVGREIVAPPPSDGAARRAIEGDGSIVGIVATDAPLLPHQLSSLAKRATLGLGRVGSIASTTSGDLFLALSTANTVMFGDRELRRFEAVPTDAIDPLYEATVQGTEEAIVNALVAVNTMTGVGGTTIPGLPQDALVSALARYRRRA